MSKVVLYDKKEKEFSNRGLGTLIDTIECTVKEKKNGMYEAYLEYPLYGPKASFLIEENIFYCSTPRGMQPFRIYRTVPDEETKIKSIYAEHIFYDLASNFIEDTNIVGRNGIGAIQQLLEKTQYSNDFIGFSDIDNIANSRQVRKSPVAAILDTDEDECILNRWGGELQRDKFQVRLLTRYGADRGVVIKYGKNLAGLIVDCDYSSITTRIMPQGYNGLFLPEKYVDSPLIDNYVFPRISKIEFSDIKVKDENSEDGYETKEQAYEALRNEVKKLYSESKIDMPKTTMTVNMIALQDTEEYKNLAILERLYPFDTVTIKHSKLNMNIKVDMNYYEWDSLADKYISMEFASDKSSFVETTATINNVKKKMDELQQSVLQEAKQTATGLINNGLGGYVLKTRDELLIMDTDDINTAQKIWRWNMGGLGYSSTGYNGEFGLAMTSDGAIVADFITTGNLNASVITTGIIKSRDGSCVLNLETGDFTFGSNDTVAKYTKKYAEFKHSNGESTRMDSSGFYRNGRPYHSLLASGTEITGGSVGVYPKTVTINLGNEWKGKTFKVIPSVQDFSGSGESIEYLHRLYLNIDSYDYANATFTATGYWVAIRDDAGVVVANEKELRWSWIAIGG